MQSFNRQHPLEKEIKLFETNFKCCVNKTSDNKDTVFIFRGGSSSLTAIVAVCLLSEMIEGIDFSIVFFSFYGELLFFNALFCLSKFNLIKKDNFRK